MLEQWARADGQEEATSDEAVYNVTEEVVVRSIQRKGLIQEKDRLVLRIAEIDADLLTIGDMQVAELAAKGAE